MLTFKRATQWAFWVFCCCIMEHLQFRILKQPLNKWYTGLSTCIIRGQSAAVMERNFETWGESRGSLKSHSLLQPGYGAGCQLRQQVGCLTKPPHTSSPCGCFISWQPGGWVSLCPRRAKLRSETCRYSNPQSHMLSLLLALSGLDSKNIAPTF